MTLKKRIDYFRNGDLRLIFYNKDNDIHAGFQGEYIEFHQNGKLRYHYMFHNNKPHGECKRFNEDGKLTFHRFCEHGSDVTAKVMPYLDDKVMFALVTDITLLPEIDVNYLHKKYMQED